MWGQRRQEQQSVVAAPTPKCRKVWCSRRPSRTLQEHRVSPRIASARYNSSDHHRGPDGCSACPSLVSKEMPPVKLAERARRIAPSATMAVDARAKEMQRAGINVVSFGAGEPDFPTPPHVKEAASRAISANFTKYTPVGGIPELREAIAQRLKEDDGRLDYRPEQIVVGNGAKDICYSICQVLLEAGDEAIIPAPYWVSYAEQVALAGAKPVIVPTREESG